MLADTTDILRDLVAFPTVSADSNRDMIAYMAERLEAAGARCTIWQDATGKKANLFATIGPNRPGGILLSGHSDVVPVTDQDWRTDPFTLTEAAGRLYGRGTCDMKGFIAACLAMAPRFAAHAGTRPLHFAFTYDEEVGCLGARQLADDLAAHDIRPALAIIGEPTEMRVVEGHKGCCEYTARFHGLEGHGSDPDQGVNAVEYAVRYVARLLELRAELITLTPPASPFEPPWTTINVGALRGGTVHNVIARSAEVDWEMRPVRWTDAEFVKDAMRRYVEDDLLPAMRAVWPDAAIDTEVIGEVAGLIPASENEARRIAYALTGNNSAGLVPFSTEGGVFQGLGMDVVVCGPGSIAQAHKADEYLDISQLSACLAMLDRLTDHLDA